MNQLIEKFARESGAWDQVYGHRTFMIDQHFDIEKFAELIVRECMEQVWYTREDSINGNISEVIKARMATHFGVEE